MANYDLMILNSRQVETTQSRPDYSHHELQYEERESGHNKLGEPTKKVQHAIIPLNDLANNPRASDSLNDIIQKFK